MSREGSGALSGAAGGAATGAAIGTFVGPVGTGLGAAIGGGLGLMQGFMGGQSAQAQADISAAQLRQQREDRDLAVKLAGPSDMELQQLEQSVNLQTKDIARRQAIVESADPALIEAGRQALELMQGKSAAGMDNLKRQRAEQRKALEQTLAQRLGTDYATSSAGTQALNQFDNQTGDLLQTHQEQTLGQFMNWSQQGAAQNSLQGGIQSGLAIAGQRGQINNRLVSAVHGTPIDPGLQYAGDLASARTNQQLFGQVFQAGGLAAGYQLGKGAAPAKT